MGLIPAREASSKIIIGSLSLLGEKDTAAVIVTLSPAEIRLPVPSAFWLFAFCEKPFFSESKGILTEIRLLTISGAKLVFSAVMVWVYWPPFSPITVSVISRFEMKMAAAILKSLQKLKTEQV